MDFGLSKCCSLNTTSHNWNTNYNYNVHTHRTLPTRPHVHYPPTHPLHYTHYTHLPRDDHGHWLHHSLSVLETVESHHLTSEVVQVVLWHDTSATLRDVAPRLIQEKDVRLLVCDFEVAKVGVSLCVCVCVCVCVCGRVEREQTVNRHHFFF